MVKILDSDNKATLRFNLFLAENKPCHENFKCGQQITCTKSFFVKLYGRLITHVKIIGQEI